MEAVSQCTCMQWNSRVSVNHELIKKVITTLIYHHDVAHMFLAQSEVTRSQFATQIKNKTVKHFIFYSFGHISISLGHCIVGDQWPSTAQIDFIEYA